MSSQLLSLKISKPLIKKLTIFYTSNNYFSKHRVVVTGLGIVSPLGVGVKHVWQRLLYGKPGIVSLSGNDYKDIPCKVAGFVPRGSEKGSLDISKELKDAELKKISLTTAYALIAANEALEDAGWLPASELDLEATGVAVGTGMVNLVDIVTTGIKLHHNGYSKVSPFFVPRILSNMPAGHIAIKFGFKGPNHSVSTACATGLHAIGDAYNFIRNGYASVMVCGSAEAVISPLSIAGFCRMRALSTHFNSLPEEASRPFDSERDGFVMGEGAGILILESLKHATERGANIYAEVLGYGLSGDAYHITSPGSGALRSMKQALSFSNTDISKVGYINAHATSTPMGDAIELKAIYDLFKDHSKMLCVSSTKGSTGHLLGAAGSVEAIFTVLSCFSKSIPTNVNCKNLDSQWPVNVILSNQCVTWPHQMEEERIALTNSFGFGGTNASVVFSNML